MESDLDRPATKRDLRSAVTELREEVFARSATKDDLKDQRRELEAVIATLATKDDLKDQRLELEAVIATLATKDDIIRLSLDNLRRDDRIDRLEAGLRGEMKKQSADFAAKLDGFMTRFENIWRESRIIPEVVDELGRRVAGHEKRIAALESKPA